MGTALRILGLADTVFHAVRVGRAPDMATCAFIH
jgi:hypothetical protein